MIGLEGRLARGAWRMQRKGAVAREATHCRVSFTSKAHESRWWKALEFESCKLWASHSFSALDPYICSMGSIATSQGRCKRLQQDKVCEEYTNFYGGCSMCSSWLNLCSSPCFRWGRRRPPAFAMAALSEFTRLASNHASLIAPLGLVTATLHCF